MSIVRPIVIALLLLAWGPAINRCVLAAAAPQIFSDCCDNSASEEGGKCADGSCPQCLSLEAGLPLSLLQALQVEGPLLKENVWQTRLLRLLTDRPDANAQITELCYTPPERPLWHFVVRTALPVRGPSIS
jgi:hypothetical protein